MKPTNRERREVADGLRRQVKRLGLQMDAHEFAHFGADVIDPDCELRWDQTMLRLADLIEPEERTCRMTVLENARGNPKYFLMYVCSECHGAVVHDKYDPIYYCPNCGAKVVSE